MKYLFNPGDQKEYRRIIQPDDEARFNGETVHHVYSTFALGRDAEWTSRQFVLEMREDDEEGVGTMLNVEHKGPAFEGEEIIFTAWVDQLKGNELICRFEARVGSRLIAVGKTGQKVLKKEKIGTIFRMARQQ